MKEKLVSLVHELSMIGDQISCQRIRSCFYSEAESNQLVLLTDAFGNVSPRT